MEVINNGMVFRFSTPAEAIEWERLRGGATILKEVQKREYPNKRRNYKSRTYSNWQMQEVHEILDVITSGKILSHTHRYAPLSAKRHSKMAVQVMANRLKACRLGRPVQKDLSKEVKEWINSYVPVRVIN